MENNKDLEAENIDGFAENLDKAANENEEKVSITEKQFSESADKSADYDKKQLEDELEQLAQTFRNELEKAQKSSAEELVRQGILNPIFEDEHGRISDDDLCRCCGEKRRDKSRGEDYEYCSDCREAMRRYPIGLANIAMFIVLAVLAAVSISMFIGDFEGYSYYKKASDSLHENKLFTSLEEYDKAIAAFESRGISAKKAYFESAMVVGSTMRNGVDSMNDISSRMKSAVTETESKMPLLSKYNSLHEEAQILYKTTVEYGQVMQKEEYASFDGKDDKMYEAIMSDFDALVGKEISVESISGEGRTYVTDEPLIRFAQYMVSYTCGRNNESVKYLELCADADPERMWLYGYLLGGAKIQSGDFDGAEKLADRMLESNAEDVDAYAIYSTVSRFKGNNRESIEQLDKGIKVDPLNNELFRLKAITYLVMGENDKAKEAIDKAKELGDNSYTLCTAIVVENELGNAGKVEEYKDSLEQNGFEISKKLNKYLAGKISVREMFTEGTGDVE